MVASVQKVYGRRRSASGRNAISMSFLTSQTIFPPVRRTARAKGSAWSAPSKRQQTITQMNPFNAIYHPEDNDENLQYLDDTTGAYEESPKPSKRRKIYEDDTPTQPTRTRVTRSTAIKTTEDPVKVAGRQVKPLKQGPSSWYDDDQDSKLMPPPPKTPVARRTEVPSSQSPIDTPLSTRRGRSIREDVSRSPLKERSLNSLIRHGTPAKESRSAAAVREIADSMDKEAESVGSAFRGYGSSLKTQTSGDTIFEDSSSFQQATLKQPKEIIDGGNCAEEVLHSQPLSQPLKSSRFQSASSQARRKVEILDSDAEDESDDDVSTSWRNRAMLHPPRRSGKASDLDTDARLQTTPPRQFRILNDILQRLSPQSLSKPPRSPQQQPTIDIPSSQPDLDTTTSPNPKPHCNPPAQTPTSTPASLKLHPSFPLPTQPTLQAGLITESQYEKGWKSYHLLPSNPTLPPSSSVLQPLSSPRPSNPEGNYHDTPRTIPTQPLPTTKRPLKTFIPPSQATTIDTTQPSQILSSSPQIQEPSTPPPPPAPPAFSSSPLLSKRGLSQGVGGEGYEWDGRVLTDSQLLPASLMEDSFGGVGSELGEEEED